MPLSGLPLGSEIAKAVRDGSSFSEGIAAAPCSAVWVRCLDADLGATVASLMVALEAELVALDPYARSESYAESLGLLRWCRRETPKEQTHTEMLDQPDGGRLRLIACAACTPVEDEPGVWARSCDVLADRVDAAGVTRETIELLSADFASLRKPDEEATLAAFAHEQALAHAAAFNESQPFHLRSVGPASP